MIAFARWAALGAVLLLSAGVSAQQAQTPAEQRRIQAFIADAAKRLEPGEAMDALMAGPPEEHYRWGQEVCGELERGGDADAIIGNLASFFGEDLSAALVGAATQVICPHVR
ncbi:MAG TPA: DUF732 domain-containing protein [Gammaproteobacteria bacterium]|nr:DUF732 domain-containing protein [Gammaproteobacteria bacterium]